MPYKVCQEMYEAATRMVADGVPYKKIAKWLGVTPAWVYSNFPVYMAKRQRGSLDFTIHNDQPKPKPQPIPQQPTVILSFTIIIKLGE